MTKCKNKRPINCLQAHPKCFQYLFHLNIMSPCPTNCINIIGGLVVSQNQKIFGSLLLSTLLDQKFGGASLAHNFFALLFFSPQFFGSQIFAHIFYGTYLSALYLFVWGGGQKLYKSKSKILKII